METKEAAARLDGNQYGEEGSPELFAAMKAAGFVALFGYSDDNVELRGAIDDEVGAYNGATIYLTAFGLVESECNNEDCPHEERKREAAARVEAEYCTTEERCWTFKTVIRHETFRILEDGDLYCRGIVFALADVPVMAEPVQP